MADYEQAVWWFQGEMSPDELIRELEREGVRENTASFENVFDNIIDKIVANQLGKHNRKTGKPNTRNDLRGLQAALKNSLISGEKSSGSWQGQSFDYNVVYDKLQEYTETENILEDVIAKLDTAPNITELEDIEKTATERDLSIEQDKRLNKQVKRERSFIRKTRKEPKEFRDKIDKISEFFGDDKINTIEDVKVLKLTSKLLMLQGFTKQEIVDNQLTSNWKRIKI